MGAEQVKSLLGGRKVKIAILLVLAFVAGYFLKSQLQKPSTGTEHKRPGDQADVQKWYCSMHPDIIRDRPGLCPICRMDLVPMPTDSGAGPRELVVSEEAAKLMEI
ncbi:MAG: heavy metal-binding domain-containing protein, partial [Planctomycetota bacterium]